MGQHWKFFSWPDIPGNIAHIFYGLFRILCDHCFEEVIVGRDSFCVSTKFDRVNERLSVVGGEGGDGDKNGVIHRCMT